LHELIAQEPENAVLGVGDRFIMERSVFEMENQVRGGGIFLGELEKIAEGHNLIFHGAQNKKPVNQAF
jgi:hypothetical protein